MDAESCVRGNERVLTDQKAGEAMGSLDGRRALVTGAGRGLGKAIALELAAEGASLIINARNMASLQEVQAEIQAMGRPCAIAAGDLSDPATTDRIIQVVREQGGLDILVNNAGINNRKLTLETTVEEFVGIMDVNLISVFRLSQAILRVMVEQQEGCIVNITSSAGKSPHPFANPAYGCSKAALTILTKELAQEFAKDHIRVNAVQCGPIETEMTHQWTPEYRDKVMHSIPVGRMGTAREVGRAVVYLCGPDAGFITGASLNINGGKLME